MRLMRLIPRELIASALWFIFWFGMLWAVLRFVA